MKKTIIILAMLIALPLLAQETGVRYDNLSVTCKTMGGINPTVKEDEPGAYTLTYEAPGKKHIMLLTVFPFKPGALTAERLKSSLKERGEKVLPMSREKELVIHDITRNGDVVGCYYALTDKNPKKGEYAYLVQGHIRYNHLAGHYTFLYNEPRDIKALHDARIETMITDTPGLTPTRHFGNIRLNENEMSNYRMEYIKHFYSIQQATFYNSGEIYDRILPPLVEKYTQSVCSDSEEGTVFYYCFKDRLDSSHRGFLTGLFYGQDGKPTQKHPEKIIMKDNYLIVLSYPFNSAIAPVLEKAILAKMK